MTRTSPGLCRTDARRRSAISPIDVTTAWAGTPSRFGALRGIAISSDRGRLATSFDAWASGAPGGPIATLEWPFNDQGRHLQSRAEAHRQRRDLLQPGASTTERVQGHRPDVSANPLRARRQRAAETAVTSGVAGPMLLIRAKVILGSALR